ncbi:MAG TPA: hypothetical protein VNA04_04210, partial [Thermoanaerobaculia bacterium]|nr:hypothetical protein [Thermoanaerobaculia bacterium]
MKPFRGIPILLLTLAVPPSAAAFEAQTPQDTARAAAVDVRLPRVIMDGVPFDIWVVAVDVPAGDSVAYSIEMPGRLAAEAGTSLAGYVSGG